MDRKVYNNALCVNNKQWKINKRLAVKEGVNKTFAEQTHIANNVVNFARRVQN